jgi:hypothetical protein
MAECFETYVMQKLKRLDGSTLLIQYINLAMLVYSDGYVVAEAELRNDGLAGSIRLADKYASTTAFLSNTAHHRWLYNPYTFLVLLQYLP